ncbi:MarR family winged helix-turn-helix transcriptional regulator [Streptomyces thermolilacinus]|uniref:MarR family transcriptional regulator n=1 Tax=Streptomyces thermolilacinus SPC6 TaxID=1306406 RepID=A0A1D3DZB1_9ACTN|nr:MarR family transcriptional regulator [Streptomyces thermolilacinus]OEJ97654.1 MarR family transcriptional regulator [Streptomyces thermolilacinus SPC6]
MDANPTSSADGSSDAARTAGEVIELLEMLWEHGREMVSPAPVSATQLRVLYALEREDGINLRTLSELLGSAPSSVSRLCDRLEALGFVERFPSSVSRRELELRLTSPAKAYLGDLRGRREEVLTASIAAMHPSTRASLLEGLRGFRSSLEGVQPVHLRHADLTDAESA